MSKDYKIGLNLTDGVVDSPNQQFYENCACGARETTPAIAIPSSKSCSIGNQ